MKEESDNTHECMESKNQNHADAGLMTIGQISEYLKVKIKTVYAWAESGELPHYKIGRLIRFKKADIDVWIEEHRQEQDKGELDRCAKKVLKTVRNAITRNPDKLVKKIIDEVKAEKYTPKNGKSDQIKGLGKEVNDGII